MLLTIVGPGADVWTEIDLRGTEADAIRAQLIFFMVVYGTSEWKMRIFFNKTSNISHTWVRGGHVNETETETSCDVHGVHGVHGVHVWCRFLGAHLTHLNLCGLGIKDEGAQLLAEGLAQMTGKASVQ